MTLIERLQEKLELRMAAWEAAKKLNDENKIEEYVKAEADVEKQDIEIARLRKMVELETRGRATVDEAAEAAERKGVKPNIVKGAALDAMSDVERRSTPEYVRAFSNFVAHRGGFSEEIDRRTIRMDYDAKGGFFMAPNEIESEIIKAARDTVAMLRIASVKTISGMAPGSNGMVMRSRMSGGAFSTELLIGSQVDDLDMDFRKMFPHPLSCWALVSNDLLEVVGGEPIRFIQEEITEANDVVLEDAFLYGTGNKQPLGVMVASADGVTTTDDVNVGSITNLTADGLLNVQYALVGKYQPGAVWGLHRTGIREVRKLKTGTGEYIWQPGLQAGQPDLLLGKPLYNMERLPTFANWTSALLVGFYGDPKYYRVLNRRGLGFKMDGSRYVELNQTLVIARSHWDGQPLISEAFKRIKLSV